MAVFLRENGVLSFGNKTPVTILQETLHRKGITPHYELIYNGVGTMDPIFKFQVSAEGLTAVGDGKSKKEAKHDAAASLLKRMQIDKEATENFGVQPTEEMEIASPYFGALKQNFVGMLDETCVTNKIPLPFFEMIKDEGPPHAKVFMMRCKVSTITETAIARTKKQAKHMAGQKMINRIADILGDEFIPPPEKPTEDFVDAKNLIAIESGNFRHDLSTPIADLQNVFFHRTEEFLLPQSFLDLSAKPEEFYDQLENPKEFLDDLLRGLEGICKIIPTSTMDLKEALEKIEKDFEKFCWVQEESCDEEEVVDCVDEDIQESYLENRVLEEFNLDDTDAETIPVSSVQQSKSLQQVQKETNIEEKPTMESIEERFKLNSGDFKVKEVESGTAENNCNEGKNNICPKKPVVLFLSVHCPQGAWTFQNAGKTEEEALNNAAIEAIKFLRIMSTPPPIVPDVEKKTNGV